MPIDEQAKRGYTSHRFLRVGTRILHESPIKRVNRMRLGSIQGRPVTLTLPSYDWFFVSSRMKTNKAFGRENICNASKEFVCWPLRFTRPRAIDETASTGSHPLDITQPVRPFWLLGRAPNSLPHT